MNIEIKLQISFQITVNKRQKNPVISVDSPSTKGSASIVWLIDQKSKAKKH